jgi:hypothetical protein
MRRKLILLWIVEAQVKITLVDLKAVEATARSLEQEKVDLLHTLASYGEAITKLVACRPNTSSGFSPAKRPIG